MRKKMSDRVFKKYLKNYLCAVLILMLLLIPVYYACYSMTKESAIKDSYDRLEKAASELDGKITSMRTIADVIFVSADVKKLAAIQGEPEAEDSYTLLKVCDSVSMAFFLGIEGDSSYLLFKDNPILISDRKIFSSREYHIYERYTPSRMSYEEWQEKIFSTGGMVQYLSEGMEILRDSDCEDEILCIVKGSSREHQGMNMAVIYRLDPELWADIPGSHPGSNDFMYVTDALGNVLYNTYQGGEELPRMEADGQKAVRLKGRGYTLLRETTPKNDITITVGISNRSIGNRIVAVNGVLWLYFGLSVAGAVVLGLWYVVRRSCQMRKLFATFTGEDGNKSFRNEYEYISSAINGVLSENEEYREKMEQVRESVRSVFIDRLLTRGLYSETEKQEAGEYLDWDMEFYCVVCAKAWENTQNIQQEFYLLECRLREQFPCMAASIDLEEQVYILGLEGEDSADGGEVLKVLEDAVTQSKGLLIGISTPGTGLENLHLCYEQALWAARSGFSQSRVGRFHPGAQPVDSRLREWMERQNLDVQLRDLLEAGEEASIQRQFDKLRKEGRRFWQESTEQDIMHLFFEILTPVSRLWNRMSLAGALPEYSSQKTMEQLLGELEEAACQICRQVLAKKEQEKIGKRQALVVFVDEHFMEPAMCVSYMAEQFGMAEKYFMACFKEAAGKNFSVYIEEKRLELARHYLLESEESIYRIAELVGYSTVDAFYKSFRKNCGMAPGKWKDSKRKETLDKLS